MSERNVYIEPEDRILLRTEDIYQTEAEDDIATYSERLLDIVADCKNSGKPEGFNAQSMVGKSKRGEVACRIFARIDPATGIIEEAGFKARGCLAMTGCASAACLLIQGKGIEDALQIGIEDIRSYVDGVPSGKVNALHFAACAIQGLVGDFLLRDNATLAELEEAVPCDEDSISCIMAEHCSLRQSRLEKRMEEEQERKCIIEETACADALDLIRANTHQGKLTCPDDWVTCVPDHLLQEEFNALVIERIQAAEEEAKAQKLERDQASASASPISPFANRGVGVPSWFKSDPSDQDKTGCSSAESREYDESTANQNEPTDYQEKSSSSVEQASLPSDPEVSTPASAEQGAAEDEVEDVEEYTEENNFGLIPPDGYKLVEVDGALALVETNESPKLRKRKANATGIKRFEGTDELYFFDGDSMTDEFARWAFLAVKDDPLATFVYCVREDSRIYPRPLAESSLSNHPFCMQQEAIREAWKQAQDDPLYADIAQTAASNGDVYYYSTDYLSPEHAASLAEWASVERFWNV